jgi:hypothetical protein
VGLGGLVVARYSRRAIWPCIRLSREGVGKAMWGKVGLGGAGSDCVTLVGLGLNSIKFP